jgi:hypothetical protein
VIFRVRGKIRRYQSQIYVMCYLDYTYGVCARVCVRVRVCGGVEEEDLRESPST